MRVIGGVRRAWQEPTEGKTKIIRDAKMEFYRTSIATASATTTRSSGNRRRGRSRSAISISVRRAKYRELDGIFLSRAIGAGYFLILVQDNPFEWRFAIVANVFVNGHEDFSISNLN